jgi:hypothetical protein
MSDDYDPAKDGHDSYYAALEDKRQRALSGGNTNICTECGKGYWVKPYRRAKSRFCSFECSGRSQARAVPNKGPKPWAAATLAKHRHKSTSRFAAGREPWNKGVKGIHLSPETEFQKGRDSDKAMPLGAVTIRTDKAGRPRAWVKTVQGWVLRAQCVYVAKHGVIPADCVVHHKDNDTLNDRPSNLVALTPAEHIREHHAELRGARKAYAQPDLFVAHPAPEPKQEGLPL